MLLLTHTHAHAATQKEAHANTTHSVLVGTQNTYLTPADNSTRTTRTHTTTTRTHSSTPSDVVCEPITQHTHIQRTKHTLSHAHAQGYVVGELLHNTQTYNAPHTHTRAHTGLCCYTTHTYNAQHTHTLTHSRTHIQRTTHTHTHSQNTGLRCW